MKHVVHYSGGTGSWGAGKLVVEEYGTQDVTFLFADTHTEDPDLYRFLKQSAAVLGMSVTYIADGRDIWQVFIDKRYLGNTRIDPCSYYLKRMLLRAWLEENCDPADTVNYIGIDWTEENRLDESVEYWAPWRVDAPLIAPPLLTKDDIAAQLTQANVELPELTRLGFPHNNCGGGCVKAGQGQFKMLLELRPDTYAVWEAGEERVRQHLQKDVAILRDRRGGTTKPLTLRMLRERIQGGGKVDEHDIGGCGCATGKKGDDEKILIALGEIRVRS